MARCHTALSCFVVLGLLWPVTSTASGMTQSTVGDPDAEAVLRARLENAQALLARSEFLPNKAVPVQCSCQNYCQGACFSSGCDTCRPSTWNYPGGEAQCKDPGPLGTGLLCTVNQTTGAVEDEACCGGASPACQLPKGSCCSSGGCSSCPKFPRLPPLFPSLRKMRRWDNTTNTCHAATPIQSDLH